MKSNGGSICSELVHSSSFTGTSPTPSSSMVRTLTTLDRCPSCSMEFVVGEQDKPSHPVVRSSEDTLNCPECNQALRVKMENRPAMSRCPLCKTEFMAEAEEA